MRRMNLENESILGDQCLCCSIVTKQRPTGAFHDKEKIESGVRLHGSLKTKYALSMTVPPAASVCAKTVSEGSPTSLVLAPSLA